jgi:hypothetical protein
VTPKQILDAVLPELHPKYGEHFLVCATPIALGAMPA